MNYKWQPNTEQLKAIEAPVEGSYRVLAPPGSGKTFLLKYRLAYLIEQGVEPNSILMVVFNKANADDMTAQVLEICPEAVTNQMSTIHAFCYRSLPTNDRRVAKDWQIKRFLSEQAEELWDDPDNRPGWKEIYSWICSSKGQGITPQESSPYFVMNLGQYHGQNVYKCNVDLANHCKGAKLITFPDMLLMIDVLLQRDSGFRAELQGRFKWVLVDEGQDVSGQAMRILTTVAAPQNNFFIVGDSDQLLYRFTGATPEANLMDGYEEKYPDGKLTKLAINYRSDCSIIYTSQKLIRNNYQPDGPYEERYMKDTAPRCGAREGDPITFTAYADATTEAEGVTEQIALHLEEIEDGGMLISGNPGNIFVGSRTRAQLAYLEGPLVRRQIPFINIAGGSFWTSKHAADVVGYLRLAQGDDQGFARAYNVASNWMTMPWKNSKRYGEYVHHRFLGKKFLEACGHKYDNVYSASRERYSWQPGVEDLTSFVNELRFREGPDDALQFILDECYIRHLKAEEGITATDEAENGKLEDLYTVVAIARDFETIPEFLAYVDRCIQAAEDAKNGDWNDYVVLSTVHRLKGLEREIVFGLGWGEGNKQLPSGETVPAGLLPHTFSLTDPPQFGVLPTGGRGRIEDERCIAFVLVTRAKSEVHLSYPMDYRGAKFGPSRFAVEMGLVEEPDDEITNGEADQASPEEPKPAIKPPVTETIIEDTINLLDRFPAEGQFQDTIYRPSAHDFVLAMPDWTPDIDARQLVMSRHLGGDSTVKVYTSVKVGRIAGGTGSDSIRVVRLDEGKRTFAFKNQQDWITRSVPQDCGAPMAHLVKKIEKQIAAFTRKCPGDPEKGESCDSLQVKCRRGSGEQMTYWWRGLTCRHSTWRKR